MNSGNKLKWSAPVRTVGHSIYSVNSFNSINPHRKLTNESDDRSKGHSLRVVGDDDDIDIDISILSVAVVGVREKSYSVGAT